MKAIVTNKRGITIVSFEGHLTFSHTTKLKETLQELYERKKNKKVAFNFEKLEFVGSSGIKSFIKMLKEFNKDTQKPRFYGLSLEYQRLFKAFEGRTPFFIFNDEHEALKSYRWTSNKRWIATKRTGRA